MANKKDGKNTGLLWLGGVIVVALGLLFVGMYGNNLKTQVVRSGAPSRTTDCISRGDRDEASRDWNSLNDEITQFQRVQITNVTYSIASKQAQISIAEARQRNGENVDVLLIGLRRDLAAKEQELRELQAQLATKMVELMRLADLKSRPICPTDTPTPTPTMTFSSTPQPTTLTPPSILRR